MSDVDIILSADASKLNRELRAAQDELDRLTRAQQRAGTAAGSLDKAVEAARKRLEAASTAAHRAGVSLDKAHGSVLDMDRGMAGLAQGAALTGSALGGMAGTLGDVGDACAMMPAPIAAATVAFAGIVAVGYGFATAAVEAARSADELSTSTGKRREYALAAGSALDAMDTEARQAYLTVGSLFAPAVSNAAYVLTGLSREARDAAIWLGADSGGLGNAFAVALQNATAFDARIGMIQNGLQRLRARGAAVEETVSTDPENMTADEAARAKEQADRLARVEQDAMNTRLDMITKEAEERRKRQQDSAKDAQREAERRAEEAKRTAEREAEERLRQQERVSDYMIKLNADQAQ